MTRVIEQVQDIDIKGMCAFAVRILLLVSLLYAHEIAVILDIAAPCMLTEMRSYSGIRAQRSRESTWEFYPASAPPLNLLDTLA